MQPVCWAGRFAFCDIDNEALIRMRDDLYPGRYGKWDEEIVLTSVDEAPRGGFDLIAVGTPPDVHIPVAVEAIEECPRAIMIEKPVCEPSLSGVIEFERSTAAKGIRVFVGYDHAVGKSGQFIVDLAKSGTLGSIETLDVEFREHWGGIFTAHPWLDGPADTYLGYWQRGGGASGEHSHAIHLWQTFARAAGAGRVTEVQAMLHYTKYGKVNYDKLCLIQLKTENGLIGRVVQDVVTSPPRKWARLQGEKGFAEWHCGSKKGADVIKFGSDNSFEENVFNKNRPDDFVAELEHINEVLKHDKSESPLDFKYGMEAMLVVAAAHKSEINKRSVNIDYSQDWSPAALT